MNIKTIDEQKLEQRVPFVRGGYRNAVYDQRYMPRWKTSKTAFYRVHGVPVIAKTEVVDLNIEGACLYVGENIHTSQQLAVKIYLSDKVSFEATGIVVWKCRQANGLFSAGILFEKLSDDIQEMILEYAFGNKSSFDLFAIG